MATALSCPLAALDAAAEVCCATAGESENKEAVAKLARDTNITGRVRGSLFMIASNRPRNMEETRSPASSIVLLFNRGIVRKFLSREAASMRNCLRTPGVRKAYERAG